MNLLVVEDEPLLADSMIHYFRNQGYTCSHADKAAKALYLIRGNEYDCIFLDLSLPDGDGMQIMREIISVQPDAAIIMVTARNAMQDRIDGLNTGADDYISKPFSLAELSARLHAVLRRRYRIRENILHLNGLELHLDNQLAMIQGNDLHLTRSEYAILRYLALNKGKTITKTSLSEHIWGDKIDEMLSLDVMQSHVKNLRKKLQEAGLPELIKTVYGVGYRLEV
jgi:DNA-binding response OmpR family regulator